MLKIKREVKSCSVNSDGIIRHLQGKRKKLDPFLYIIFKILINKMHKCKKQTFRLIKRKYKKIFCVIGLGKDYFK